MSQLLSGALYGTFLLALITTPLPAFTSLALATVAMIACNYYRAEVEHAVHAGQARMEEIFGPLDMQAHRGALVIAVHPYAYRMLAKLTMVKTAVTAVAEFVYNSLTITMRVRLATILTRTYGFLGSCYEAICLFRAVFQSIVRLLDLLERTLALFLNKDATTAILAVVRLSLVLMLYRVVSLFAQRTATLLYAGLRIAVYALNLPVRLVRSVLGF